MSATKIEMARPFVNEIIFFFRNQIAEMNQPDLVESLEVAIQCIEAVYSLPDEAIETAGDRVDLFELYENSRAILPDDKVAESEHLKNEGNRLMKEEKYAEAISMYTQAINIDSRNPIFYCNRAAAWTRTGDYEKSISDANLSLRYNPRYSKAFVRQGDAYFRMEKFKEAADAYQKAIEIEPDNEDYKNKSAMAMQRSLQNIQASSGMPQNNALMSMMSQIINNPGMQELLPRLRNMISDGEMTAISSQMQNVMQNPDVWNNLDSLLMQNLGNPGGASNSQDSDAGNNSNPPDNEPQ